MCERSNVLDQESNTSCKIVDIRDFGEHREKKLEEWLIQRMSETYHDISDFTVKNPLTRILTKFDALSKEAQYELYGYVECAADGKTSIHDEFFYYLEKVPSAWEDIEGFANELLYKEKTYQQIENY